MFDLHLKRFFKKYVTILFITVSCLIEVFFCISSLYCQSNLIELICNFLKYMHLSSIVLISFFRFMYISRYTHISMSLFGKIGSCINCHLVWNAWSEMHDFVIFQTQFFLLFDLSFTFIEYPESKLHYKEIMTNGKVNYCWILSSFKRPRANTCVKWWLSRCSSQRFTDKYSKLSPFSCKTSTMNKSI